MNDNELDSLRMALEQAANGGRSNADVRACCADANDAISAMRARVAELEARIEEAEKQEPVAMVVHHNPPFGAVYKVEWYTKYRDLPDGTKLYAGSAPVPAAQRDLDEIIAELRATPPADAAHPDDVAVDHFAAAMKAKMAASRAKGRGGWENTDVCPPGMLQGMLVDHLSKGDPVDVGNFAMMLFNRGEKTTMRPADAALADALEHAGTRAEFHPDSEIAVLCRKAAAALRARAVPEGYALVPVEPTNEMYHAGVNAISSVWMNPEGTAPVGGYGAYVRRVWPAMLAAKAKGGAK